MRCLRSGSTSRARHDRTWAALAERTSETVHVSVLDGAEVLYVDKVESPQPVRAYSRVGGRAPAYCVATGKALLAHAPDGVVAELSAALVRYTPRTITDPEALRKELRRVREIGVRGEQPRRMAGRPSAASPHRSSTLPAWRSPRSASPG